MHSHFMVLRRNMPSSYLFLFQFSLIMLLGVGALSLFVGPRAALADYRENDNLGPIIDHPDNPLGNDIVIYVDNNGTNNQRIGSAKDGSNNNYNKWTINIDGNINTGSSQAISVGDESIIIISPNYTVENSALAGDSGGCTAFDGTIGCYNTGANTIEMNSASFMSIEGTVQQNGNSSNSQAINAHAGGNAISIQASGKVINSGPSAAIWFQDISTDGGRNAVFNYGLLERTDKGDVLGSSGSNGVDFSNYIDGIVVGNIKLSGGDDYLYFYTQQTIGAASINGNIDGGGGSNVLSLLGGNTDTIKGEVKNFETINKSSGGHWKISGPLSGIHDINVIEGILELEANNSSFTGTISISNDIGARLITSAQGLSASILNEDFLEFKQTDAHGVGTYAGTIIGIGNLEKSGNGTVRLIGNNSYSGFTNILDGTLAISGDGAIGTGALRIGDIGSTYLEKPVLSFTNNTTLSTDRQIILGQSGGTIDTGGYDVTIARGAVNDLIIGSGGSNADKFTKTGKGTLTLARDLKNKGGLDVLGGTLKIANVSVLDGTNSAVYDVNVDGLGSKLSVEGQIGTTLWRVNDVTVSSGGSMILDATTDIGASKIYSSGNFNVVSGGMVSFDGNAKADSTGNALIGSNSKLGGWGSLDLNGGTGSLNNEGLLFAGNDGNYFSNFTVDGNYIAASSTSMLMVNAVLGGDSSPAGIIHITGSVSGGSSHLKVNNMGGVGAQTNVGIPVITTGGSNYGDFKLVPDYITQEGVETIVGGAHLYDLKKGGNGGVSNNWYLTTHYNAQGQKAVNPAVPIYESYPQAIAIMARLNTLQQRIGSRSWWGKDDNKRSISIAPSGGGNYWADSSQHNDGLGLWVSIDGAKGRLSDALASGPADFDYNYHRFNFGMDFPLYQSNEGSKLMGGLNVSFGKMKSDLESTFASGKSDIDSRSIGGTLTWYSPAGFYFDSQAKVNWLDGDLTSHSLMPSGNLLTGNKGTAYAFSLEGGQVVNLNNNWYLVPQVQLAYSTVDFESFTDSYGVKAKLDKHDSLEGRLGMSLNYETKGVSNSGDVYRSRAYSLANIYHEFLGDSELDISGEKFKSRGSHTWLGLSLGGSHNWANDRVSIYGEVGGKTSTSSFGDDYEMTGEIGFRVMF